MSGWLDALAARLPAAPRTRFAPAPTGALHLGHVVNACFVWGVARALGGTVVLRIEDHDGTRSRETHLAALLNDLAWLGFVPDEGAPPALIRQSARGAVYEAALARLASRTAVYACACSRRTLAASSTESASAEASSSAASPSLAASVEASSSVAAFAAGEERPYPGTCRTLGLPHAPGYGLRAVLPDTTIAFDDALLGPQLQQPATRCGDLLVRDRLGQWTYQFAVVADDQAQGIDLVIRGRDLLASTGRQWLLADLLGRATPPVALHHPLLVHQDGRKLSKSDGATGLAELRDAGAGPHDVIGLAAARAGLLDAPRPLAPTELPAVLAARAAADLRTDRVADPATGPGGATFRGARASS